MNLDLYHAQIGEGNLIELVRRCLPYVGEIQVADVPGRCEPGTGEINYPAIARALADAGYTGAVGLEAFASGDSEVALERFRAAFTGLRGSIRATGPHRRPRGSFAGAAPADRRRDPGGHARRLRGTTTRPLPDHH